MACAAWSSAMMKRMFGRSAGCAVPATAASSTVRAGLSTAGMLTPLRSPERGAYNRRPVSALDDLIKRFRRAAAPAQQTRETREHFDWEPERVMPAKEPRRREPSREPAPAGNTPVPSWKTANAEPTSVVGRTIPVDVADFATVYKGAGVHVPAHGYGVDRVAEMLAHKSLA